MSDRATVTEYTCFDRNCDKLNAPYSVISTVSYMTISYMKFNIQCVPSRQARSYINQRSHLDNI